MYFCVSQKKRKGVFRAPMPKENSVGRSGKHFFFFFFAQSYFGRLGAQTMSGKLGTLQITPRSTENVVLGLIVEKIL